VNKIGVGRHRSGLANIGCDLAAMIGGVHENVSQYVANQALVGFTLAVFVCNGSIKQIGGVISEVRSP